MSFFTHGAVDVWCGGYLILHTVWWMSRVVDVIFYTRCGGCCTIHDIGDFNKMLNHDIRIAIEIRFYSCTFKSKGRPVIQVNAN